MTTLNQTRSLSLTPALLSALRELVVADRAAADAVESLRNAGFRAGESFHSLFEGSEGDGMRTGAGEELSATEFWERFSRFWSSTGWGELRHRDLHPGVSALESSDWAEADLPSGVRGCHLTTGILAEVLRRVAGQEIAVLEAGCRSRGDDSCSFLIGSQETLAALYAALRAGRSLDEAVAELR